MASALPERQHELPQTSAPPLVVKGQSGQSGSVHNRSVMLIVGLRAKSWAKLDSTPLLLGLYHNIRDLGPL
jgi:hypothetical protein